MKREWFYGARVRGLAVAALILLAVALILVLATLPPETLPAETLPAETLPSAPTEQAASATPTSFPSSTPSPTHELSPTVTSLPASTVTPTLSATPAATTVPAATFSPTATAKPSPSVEPELSPTTTPTLEAEGVLRRVVLIGDLQALKRDGQIAWPAVQLQCWNASDQEIGRVALTQLECTYRLPDDTTRVQLWIGSELGAADWWRDWDSLPAEAASPEIVLIIVRVKHEVPTLTPPLPPTLRPTKAPTVTLTPCPP